MLIGDVRPSTIEGLKSLAAQYRKVQGIKHTTALDLAAKAANCANYKHALRTLPTTGLGLERPYVLLTIYWCDKDKRFQVGRETLKIVLAKPILETCSRNALKLIRGFGNLRMVAPDHFVCDAIADTQTHARERLSTAERSLRFMEHTGLQPTRDFRKAYPNGRADDKLPGNDHATDWIDPETGQFILIDEPYSAAPDEVERASWSQQTGWRVVKTTWPGMYYPHSCDLYVATDARTGYDVDSLVATINAIPAPLVGKEWVGESSPSWDVFTSPMAKTPQDIRRARCRGTIYPAATKTTLPYSYAMGSDRRRPAAALLSDQRPYSVYRRLNSVRSTLEDWMGIEIGRGQLDGPEFFDVYYHETESDAQNRERARSRAGLIELLGELKQKLQTAYPDCEPLRQQLDKIDMSMAVIAKMKTVS